jgi:protein-S-isoprenylcysteine O-methyltransferase Ste14
MNRVEAAIGSIVFLFLAPGTVAGLVPWLISGWAFQPPFFEAEAVRWAGSALMGAGLVVLLDSFARFAIEGVGTPAPVMPTQHLVVSGWYRYVRNPMYVAVVSAILGQALWFADAWLLVYAAGVWLGFQGFVTLYEEPTLRRTYGQDYEVYCHGVRRWLPRLTPWHAQL